MHFLFLSRHQSLSFNDTSPVPIDRPGPSPDTSSLAKMSELKEGNQFFFAICRTPSMCIGYHMKLGMPYKMQLQENYNPTDKSLVQTPAAKDI